eukprot:jgi/Tetstr1/440495/TSEL_028820.t2
MLAAMPPSDDTERPSPPLGAGLADPFREDKSGGEAAGAMAAVTISMAAARPAFRSDRVRTEQRGCEGRGVPSDPTDPPSARYRRVASRSRQIVPRPTSSMDASSSSNAVHVLFYATSGLDRHWDEAGGASLGQGRYCETLKVSTTDTSMYVTSPGACQLRTQASQGRRRWPGNLASRAMLEGGTPASLLHQVAVLADFDGSVQLREEAGPRKAVEPFWRRASLHLCWVSGGGGAIGGHRTLICLLHEWAHCVHVCCSHHLLVAPNGALEEAEGGLWCAGGGHVSDELEQELIQVR